MDMYLCERLSNGPNTKVYRKFSTPPNGADIIQMYLMGDNKHVRDVPNAFVGQFDIHGPNAATVTCNSMGVYITEPFSGLVYDIDKPLLKSCVRPSRTQQSNVLGP